METEEALLDNPIWNSLNGHQLDYAVGNEISKRFQSDVDWFASFASLDSANWIALAGRCKAKFGLCPYPVPTEAKFIGYRDTALPPNILKFLLLECNPLALSAMCASWHLPPQTGAAFGVDQQSTDYVHCVKILYNCRHG